MNESVTESIIKEITKFFIKLRHTSLQRMQQKLNFFYPLKLQDAVPVPPVDCWEPSQEKIFNFTVRQNGNEYITCIWDKKIDTTKNEFWVRNSTSKYC